MSFFSITAAATSIRLDASGTGRNTFTLSNNSGHSARVRVDLRAQEPAQQEWLSIEGEVEREFPAGGTQQVAGKVTVPAGTAPGTYAFRLNVVSVDNPDDDFAEGPSISFEVAESAPKKGFPWWIPVAAVIVLGLGIGAWFIFSGGVPDVVGQDAKAAQTKLAEAKFEIGTVTKRFTGRKQPGTVLEQKLREGEQIVDLFVEPYLLATNNLDPDPLGEFNLAVEVPDFTGQNIRQAALRIRDLNIKYQAVAREALVADSGTISAQAPAAGTVIKPEEKMEVTQLLKAPDKPSKRDLFQNPSVGTASPTLGSFNKQLLFDGAGVCYGSESGNTLFRDGQRKGTVHFVEWSTKTPVSLEGLRLFAAHDSVRCTTPANASQRAISNFKILTKLQKEDKFKEILSEKVQVPYQFVNNTHGLVFERDSLSVKAQYFRAEFTQNGATGFSGPRIMELDGFGSPVEP